MANNALISLTEKLSGRFDIQSSGADVIGILKATAFKGPANDAQLTALIIVANQYGLNPWTKEIYAFPDKGGGIVPVVGVDGWARIINEHPNFDGMNFTNDEDSCTCTIFRKDRAHPISVTEYLGECSRDTQPWKSHPKRMLRHKAMIQCARLAFGYVGIFDQDEAERIAEIDITPRKNAITIAENARYEIDQSPEAEDIIKTLEQIASTGVIEAYSVAWGGLTKDQRKTIGNDGHQRLKAIAEAVRND